MSYKTGFDKITFNDSAEYISGDGTDLSIVSSNLINIKLGNTDDSTKLSILNSDSSEVTYITDTGLMNGLNFTTTGGTDMNALGQINTDKSDPRGFVDSSHMSLTFDNGTMTLTLTSSEGSFSYYTITKYTKTGVQTFEISDVEGIHYIYYNSENITETTTFSLDLIEKYAWIACIYWDKTNSKALYIGHEYRHGIIMSSQTHAYLHLVQGFMLESGGQLGDILADENGSIPAHCEFSNTASVGWDEDARFTPSARLSTANIPVFYRDGLDTSNIWRSNETASFPVLITGTNRANYNQLTGGSWQQTEVGNKDFVLCHVAITNDVDRPYVVFQGQNLYTRKRDARDGAEIEINSLITEGLPIIEFKFVATIIIQTDDNYANTVKSRIVTTNDGSDYVDLRGSVIGRIGTSATVSDHNALANVALATTGITYGHIDDQSQSLYGVKTFVDGIAFVDVGEYISGNGTDLTIGSGAYINLTATADVIIPVNIGLIFGDGTEKIESDNTNLTVSSGGDINLTPSTTFDVNIPQDIGLTFGADTFKIESNGTDFTINSLNNLNLTATADVIIPVNIGLIFGDGGEKIESDNTDLTLTSGNNIDLIATNEISFNTDTGNILRILGDDTSTYLISSNRLSLSNDAGSSNIELDSNIYLDSDYVQFRKSDASKVQLILDQPNELMTSYNNIVINTSNLTPTVIGDESRLYLFNNYASGAGGQGYFGTLCFGGSDSIVIGTASSYFVSGISSQSIYDMSSTSQPGNLEFYTTQNLSITPVKNLVIDYDGSIIIPNSGQKLCFVDSSEYISGDGTDLTISSGNNITLDGNVDITGSLSLDSNSIYGLPIGSVISYTNNTPPSGYLMCDGSAISRSVYAQLFTIIGTTYGVGDGSTTFNLPNIEGRTIVGKGSEVEFNTLGKTGGEKTHVLSTAEMPVHNHTTTENSHRHISPICMNPGLQTYYGETNITETTTGLYYEVGNTAEGNEVLGYTSSSTTGITIDNTGSGEAHNIIQPYITLNYCIKYSDVVVHSIIDDLETLHWDETEAELKVVIGATDIITFQTDEIVAYTPISIEGNNGLSIGQSSSHNTTIFDHNSIQLATTTYFGDGALYDEHCGVCLYSQMNGGWGTADLRIKTSVSHGEYELTETAMIISNDKTTIRKDLDVGGDLNVSGNFSGSIFPKSIVRYETTQTISIPAGCNGLILEIVGGGGGAGGIQGASDSSGGGGAGGYVKIYITKTMISDLSLSSIYFQCGTGGAGKDTNDNGDPGLPSYCKENDVNGNQIAQADGGQEGFRGAEYSRGGISGYGSVELAYDDICEIIYGEIGNRGHNTGLSTPVMFGGYGGKSYFGRGGRGASEWSLPESGIKGGGGGGTIQSVGVGSGSGGNGMMQITFY